jgi:hypothetical protein
MAKTQYMVRRLLSLGLAFALILIQSCKPDEDLQELEPQSAIATLDNFAIAEPSQFSWNFCVGSQARYNSMDKFIDFERQVEFRNVDNQELVLQELRYTLAAVPEYVLGIFARMPNSKIILSSNLGDVCSGSNESDASQFQENGHTLACWKRIKQDGVEIYIDPFPAPSTTITPPAGTGKGGKGSSSPRVVTSDEPFFYGIHHATVRAFGYFASQVLLSADIVEVPSGTQKGGGKGGAPTDFQWKERSQPNDRDAKFLRNLTEAFYRDDFGNPMPERGSFTPETLTNDVKNLTPYIDLLNGTPQQFRLFEYFVFAEVFDSYYCNTETRTLLQTRYPNVFPLMQQASQSFGIIEEGQGIPNKECIVGCHLKRIGRAIVDFFVGFGKFAVGATLGFVGGVMDSAATAVEWLAYGQPVAGVMPGMGQPMPLPGYGPNPVPSYLPVPPATNPYQDPRGYYGGNNYYDDYDARRRRLEEEERQRLLYATNNNTNRTQVKKKRCGSISMDQTSHIWFGLFLLSPFLLAMLGRESKKTPK